MNGPEPGAGNTMTMTGRNLQSSTDPRPTPFYPFTVLRFLVGYTTYFLSKAVFVVIGLPGCLLLSPFPRAKQRALEAVTKRYLAFLTRGWLPFLGLYRIMEISGLDRALAARPVVYVANHRSYLDSVLLLGLLPRTGVLIKSNYGRGPMYQLLIRHFDLVSLNRDSLTSVAEALGRCKAILTRGKNILVFPEGTRARSGRLKPFNRAAFDLALTAGVPVVPVIVHSTQPFMAKLPGSIFPRQRNEYRLRFLDPETARPNDNANSLCDRVYRRMTRELKQLDAGTSWEIQSPQA